MKKKFNITLLKSIIETEFFLLSSNLKRKTNNFNLATSLQKDAVFGLDTFELVKNLKQLVRTLQFLNEKKKFFVFCSPNKNSLGLLDLYCSKLNLNKLITIQNDSTKIAFSYKSTQALLSLDEDSPKNNTVGLVKLLEKNILIIHKINSRSELKNFGAYKIYNDLSNYKKLAFLITLFHQILKVQ